MAIVVAIVGSRDWHDWASIRCFIDKLYAKYPDATVLSGGARGVDQYAVRYAHELGMQTWEMRADWSLGKSAGFIRNVQMIKHADIVVAFWDGHSRGTAHSIRCAEEQGKLRGVYQPRASHRQPLLNLVGEEGTVLAAREVAA